MKALFWIGLLVVILGLASLVVPIPHREKHGLTVGGVSVGVETRNEDKASPALSAIMIAAGLGAMVTGKRKTSG